MKIDDLLDREDFIYSIRQLSHRMLSGVRVLEAPTVEQVRISDKKQTIAKNSEETSVFTPTTFQSSQRHLTVDSSSPSDRWGFGVAQAALNLKATTQKYVRSALLPLARRYRVDRMFGQKMFNAHVYTDTIDARVASIHGNRYVQVFAIKEYFFDVYPNKKKSHCGDGLSEFIMDYGVPLEMTFDGYKEQTMQGTDFMKKIRKYDIDYHVSEPDRPNRNPADGVIRELRRKWFRMMVKKRVPRRLWDYGY